MKFDNLIKYFAYISSITFVFIEDIGISTFQIKILTILLTIDIITGVLKSYVCRGGNSVRSKILYAGVLAKLLILLTPVVLQLCFRGIGINSDFLIKFVFCYFIVSETYSFFNNVLSIKKRENLKEYDSLTIIAKIIRTFLLKFLEITRSNIETSLDNILDKMDKKGDGYEVKKKNKK